MASPPLPLLKQWNIWRSRLTINDGLRSLENGERALNRFGPAGFKERRAPMTSTMSIDASTFSMMSREYFSTGCFPLDCPTSVSHTAFAALQVPLAISFVVFFASRDTIPHSKPCQHLHCTPFSPVLSNLMENFHQNGEFAVDAVCEFVV